MREMVLCLICPPGLLECPLHCHQEYPGKITHTLPGCEASDWWIGTAGDGFYWLVVYWESVVHDHMMIFPCMSPPPLSKTSFLSLFLQQKTPGCSQPTHCHTTFRALLAWLDTHTHTRSCLHFYNHFHLLFSMCTPLSTLFYSWSW